MYIYFTVFLLCFVLGTWSLKIKVHDVTVKVLLFVLFLLLAFRYGQGSDYFGYQILFSYNSNLTEAINNTSSHGEIGFRLLCVLFRENYPLMVFTVSAYQCLMLGIFLEKHSANKAFSLLLFFPTMFLTYYFSVMRQGIMIATFLGIGISLIERHAWVRYVLMCLVLSTLHTVSLALLAIPLLMLIKHFFPLFWFILPISAMIGFFLTSEWGIAFMANIPYLGSYLSHYLTVGFSTAAILERIATLFIVLMCYYSSSYYRENRTPWWIRAFIFGFILYFLLLPFSLISTRVLICFKVLEVMIIPELIEKESNRFRQVAAAYFLMLSIVSYFHNVRGYLDQGEYFEDINAVNYPYVSIFNQDDLWKYREYDRYYLSMNS